MRRLRLPSGQQRSRNLSAEMCVETDIHVTELTAILPSDCSSSGFPDGCTMLLGGDHGGHCFHFHAKMHFSSNTNASTTKICHTDARCAEDQHDLLEQTIAPKLDEHMRAMQNGSVVVVHDKTNLEQRKSHLVPTNIDMKSIKFTPENKLVCRIDGSDEQVEVDVDLWEDSSCWNLLVTKVMSKWNDLHVGDLALLALCLGMVSSDCHHCIFCEWNGRTFNCDCHAEEQRTNAKILECQLEFRADFERHELMKTNNQQREGHQLTILDSTN
jgi:hypothetical protein